MKIILNLNYDVFFCALAPMKQDHHDGGTETGRNEPTSTQGAEATGIHTRRMYIIVRRAGATRDSAASRSCCAARSR